MADSVPYRPVALTLIQPWATLIMHFGKDLENRDWAPSPTLLRPGQKFLVHAGAKEDKSDVAWARRQVPGFEPYYREAPLPRMAILGSVRFTGVHTSAPQPPQSAFWWSGCKFGWGLSDAKAFENPIENVRGALGLWRMPESILDRIRMEILAHG